MNVLWEIVVNYIIRILYRLTYYICHNVYNLKKINVKQKWKFIDTCNINHKLYQMSNELLYIFLGVTVTFNLTQFINTAYIVFILSYFFMS